MRSALVLLVIEAALVSCDAPRARQPAPCRTDIADCAAACALRERGLPLQAEELDRRCAAAVLGVDLDAPANERAQPAQGNAEGAAPSHDAGAGPWRPFTIARKDPPGEPPECVAARTLRDKHLVNEAETMSALCAAKGGKP